ncbi:MAG: hypothetical protein JXR84_08595 [Anaerolineae bacterium]|nr:hypothetical protein [Anaerolineae bacterium]
MNPQLGKAVFRIIVFITVTSLLLLPFVKPGSAEFIVTVVTLTIGIFFGIVLFVLVRRQSR